MTREEFEQYAIKNNLVVWSKEQSESAIKALEELPKRRKDAKRWKARAAQSKCEEAISRQAVHDAVYRASGLAGAMRAIDNLPPVNPQPKTGHWTHDGSHWENRFICSECGYKLFDEPTNYCPNCGRCMV